MSPSSSFALSLNSNVEYRALNLLAGLKNADRLAVALVGGHAVPGRGLELRSRLGDDLVQALGQLAVLRGHLGDLVEQVLLADGALGLLGALLHRGALLGAEPALAARGLGAAFFAWPSCAGFLVLARGRHGVSPRSWWAVETILRGQAPPALLET